MWAVGRPLATANCRSSSLMILMYTSLLFHPNYIELFICVFIILCSAWLLQFFRLLREWGVVVATCAPILCYAQSEAIATNYTTCLHVHAITISAISAPLMETQTNHSTWTLFSSSNKIPTQKNSSVQRFAKKNICILFELHIASSFSVPVAACRAFRMRSTDESKSPKKNTTISCNKIKGNESEWDGDNRHKFAFNYL